MEGLDVVIASLHRDVADGLASAGQIRRDTTGVDRRIRAVSARLDRMLEKVGLPSRPEASRAGAQPGPGPQTPPGRGLVPWDEVVASAEERLRDRGVDPEVVSVDDLLDPDEAAHIERRFTAGLDVRARLDCYDVLVAVTAGLVAATVDFFIVRLPRPIAYLGRPAEGRGSVITEWLHSLSIPSDNWLARHFRTSYDAIASVADQADGLGPKTHRLQTPGHDPLVGLVVGTIDILRGGLTAVSQTGQIASFSGLADPVPSLLEALVIQIGHLLSDAPTRMGLPPPGWSLTPLLQAGSFGPKGRTLADLARDMYLRGYDSRHFFTMVTSCAAAEVVLRGYFGLRQERDPEYEEATQAERETARATSVSGHPRFQAMALAAHGIAAAANAGRIAITGHPLALNYPQWLAFLRAFFVWYQGNRRWRTDRLVARAEANAQLIAGGWPPVGADDPEFPTLRT